MTIRQLYRQETRRLEEAGCDSPEFDAACLAEAVWGLDQIGRAHV